MNRRAILKAILALPGFAIVPMPEAATVPWTANNPQRVTLTGTRTLTFAEPWGSFPTHWTSQVHLSAAGLAIVKAAVTKADP